MSVSVIAADLKAGFEAEKADAEGKMAQVDQLVVDADAEKQAYGAEQFQAGLNQATVPGDKVWTDADMDAEIKPRDEKIAAQELEIASLKTDLDAAKAASADMDAVKAELDKTKADFDAYKQANLAQAQS